MGNNSSALIDATAENHKSWFLARCIAQGGYSCETQGIQWLCSPDDATIPFPSEEALKSNDWLGDILQQCERIRPKQIACWVATERDSMKLGALLMAHGFEWGWKPQWMALNLADIDQYAANVSVEMGQDNSGTVGDPRLPYFNDREGRVLSAILKREPRDTWRVIATVNSQVVAHAIAHRSPLCPQVIGLYSIGVQPDFRSRGFGKAITLACARLGRELGCQYAVLNAANDFYKGFGFSTQGFGQTWWMHDSGGTYTIGQKDIRFATAIATGNCSDLEEFRYDEARLTNPLRCGLTALELAAQFKQASCGEMLIRHGAPLDILALWDLGLHSYLNELLINEPERVNQKRGQSGATALHYAILRNDAELARVLLEAQPDLTITDDEAHSTPLGWARYFKRDDIASLIERQQTER